MRPNTRATAGLSSRHGNERLLAYPVSRITRHSSFVTALVFEQGILAQPIEAKYSGFRA